MCNEDETEDGGVRAPENFSPAQLVLTKVMADVFQVFPGTNTDDDIAVLEFLVYAAKRARTRVKKKKDDGMKLAGAEVEDTIKKSPVQ